MNKNKSGANKVLNVKINSNEEIEFVDVLQENSQDSQVYEIELIEEDDDGQYEVHEYENQEEVEEEEEPELIQTDDGRMIIKLKEETVIEHVCGKCNRTYGDLVSLKRHLPKCRNKQIIMKNDDISESEESETEIQIKNSKIKGLRSKKGNPVTQHKRKLLCFCCDEEKIYAHEGHLKCKECSFSFKTHMSLEKHVFSLHCKNKEYSCDACSVSCPSKGILELHNQTHKTNKPFSCKRCGRDFTRKYHLDRHLAHTSCDDSVPKTLLPCAVCGKEFTRTDNLREHLRGHMGQSNRKRDYQCTYCDKSFYGSSLLNIHIRTHTGEKPFPCDLCPKSFSSTGALRKHRRMHTGERPYQCTECSSTFSAKETLNRHFKIHTGHRPHACTICDKSFIQATQLRAHMFHHTGENGFECEFCGRVFNRKSRLLTHVKFIHCGEKPMECQICNKSFPSQIELDRHVELHKGIKNFDCNICSKKFATKASLASHLRTHIKEEPCACEICKSTFKRLDCLIRHVRKCHREVLFKIITEEEKKKMKIIEIRKKSKTNNNNKDDDDNGDNTSDSGELDECSENENEQPTDNEMITDEIEIIDNFKIKKESITQTQINDEYSTEEQEEENTIFMDDQLLKESISELLNLLVDEETLQTFGWPETSVEEVLCNVIKKCGHTPADYRDCNDYTTKMRENTKLLFTVVIDDDSIKELLNNHTVDEVILRVLKLAKAK